MAIIGGLGIGLNHLYPGDYERIIVGISSFFLVLSVSLPLFHCCAHERSRSRDRRRIARKIKKFFEKENREIYTKRGLRWQLNRYNISWVELWLDYKSKAPKNKKLVLPTTEDVMRLVRADT